MRAFHSFADIIALWKSAAAAGRDLGIKDGTLRKYATGERPFPPEKFDDLVREARRRPGGETVTHELVCRLAAARSRAGADALKPAETKEGECFT